MGIFPGHYKVLKREFAKYKPTGNFVAADVGWLRRCLAKGASNYVVQLAAFCQPSHLPWNVVLTNMLDLH